MADKHDKRPHGETGDTVGQAAEVSRPTTTVYPDLDNTKPPQAPPDPETGSGPKQTGGTAPSGA